MLKTRIVGRTAVITADMSYEKMELVSKYKPETMIQKDKDGNEEFSVKLAASGNGSVNGLCVSFVKDGDKAIATVCIPEKDAKGDEITNKAEWFAEEYGIALSKATEVLQEMADNMGAISTLVAKIKDAIEVL